MNTTKKKHKLLQHSISTHEFSTVEDFKLIQKEYQKYHRAVVDAGLRVEVVVENAEDLYNQCTVFTIYCVGNESDIALLKLMTA